MRVLLILLTFSLLPAQWEIAKSAILPGWGNYSAGNETSAYWHWAAEAILWFGLVQNQVAEDAAVNDYQSYAAHRLGIGHNQSDSYYELLADYQSYEEYIEFRRRQGQSVSGDLPESKAWRWRSASDQDKFALRRLQAIEYEKDLKFWIAGLVLNRLASMLTTARDVRISSSASFDRRMGNRIRISAHISF